MKVRWSANAKRNRREIFRYIAFDDRAAAVRIDLLFKEAAERLGTFPHMGRPGTIAGTRELIPHPSYRLIYQVGHEALSILALMHTSRQWPPASEEPS